PTCVLFDTFAMFPQRGGQAVRIIVLCHLGLGPATPHTSLKMTRPGPRPFTGRARYPSKLLRGWERNEKSTTARPRPNQMLRRGLCSSSQKEGEAPLRSPIAGISGCTRRERPCCGRAAKCGQQFSPSDGDCHTPLPCEVRKGNDTTPRACCPL